MNEAVYAKFDAVDVQRMSQTILKYLRDYQVESPSAGRGHVPEVTQACATTFVVDLINTM